MFSVAALGFAARATPTKCRRIYGKVTLPDARHTGGRNRMPHALDELSDFDTPSITNVVATYPASPLCLGLYNPWTENWYTDQSIRCMYPELGRLAGYAVTCVYGLPDPNFSRLSFLDVIDALDASPKP